MNDFNIQCFSLSAAAVAVAVQGRAQQQRRGGRQLDTGYGAPAEASYGAPSEQIDVRSQELPGYDDNLSSYEGGDLDAQASNLDAREGEEESENGLDMLMKSVPGIPGEDYPIYAEAPETEFSCDTGVNGGTNCCLQPQQAINPLLKTISRILRRSRCRMPGLSYLYPRRQWWARQVLLPLP
jgi:hypothetical protein